MKVLRAVEELRSQLTPARREGLEIGLVPTMGALHEGHLSLIREARESCDVVVVTLFVNPSQFNERADLEHYPRSEQRDAELAATAGADILFAPSVEVVYPAGFATSVEVLGVSERLEGATRGAEHFRGVATVVAKLLCMVLPDRVFFGRKDAQQVAVIRRLVEDLNLPVQIVALPTVREPDGLAMSSRNALLSAPERERALALSKALKAAADLAAEGERSAQTLIEAATEELEQQALEIDYVALVDPASFESLQRLDGEALLAIAARVGQVRLIDNAVLQPSENPMSMSHPNPQGKAIAKCSA